MTLSGDDFAGWTPYRPPWYPADLPEPGTIVLVASGDVVSNYARWERSLEPGELARLVREHREAQP